MKFIGTTVILIALALPASASAGYLHEREARFQTKIMAVKLVAKTRENDRYVLRDCKRIDAHHVNCALALFTNLKIGLTERCDYLSRVVKSRRGLRARATWQECYEA